MRDDRWGGVGGESGNEAEKQRNERSRTEHGNPVSHNIPRGVHGRIMGTISSHSKEIVGSPPNFMRQEPRKGSKNFCISPLPPIE